MTESIDNEVLDILAKHTEVGREKMSLDTRLNTIGVESLMMVEIIYDLEERFDISIPDPDFVGEQPFKTARDIVGAIKELIEQQQNTP